VDLAVIGLSFISIFLVELPDKTFLATLALATKYRPLLVWIGVGLAFTVQTIVAVTAGGLISLLPSKWVHLAAGALFIIGAVILFREGRSAADEDEENVADKAEPATGVRAVVACFLVLFLAEWGDLSQLLSVSLVARYKDPISVFIGALAALLLVSALAVVLGKQLLRFIKLHVLHFISAALCLAIGVFTVVETLT
jgi:Ca2+/H+ antiporter, TMEM165/GDT1 family